MPFLLDSTLFIDHANGDQGAIEFLRGLFERNDESYVTDVVVCEVLSLGDDDSIAYLERLLDAFEYVAVPPSAARWAGAARRARHGAGGKRAVGDALIAGLAMDLGATVVTRNVRDFTTQGVPVVSY